MMRIILLVPALLAATAAVAGDHPNPRDAAAVDRALAGRTPGLPRDCLSSADSQSSSTHDGVVLFRASPRITYINRMQDCSLMREDDILQTNLYGTSRLCRGDIAQIIDRAGHYTKGACTFGEFVPYTRAPQAR